MTELERVQDIMSIGEFNEADIKKSVKLKWTHDFASESGRYQKIFYFSMEEVGIADPEILKTFDILSNFNCRTEKGYIYAFK